jgi:hypothetical protein
VPEAGSTPPDAGLSASRRPAGPGAAAATTLYALVAIAWTWPLATGLARDLPWDLGDALLNCWILAWHFHQAGRLLHGDAGALADWWHPNIFHPSPYSLGQSELLVAQAFQGAPVYLVTGNLILTYNLLFLSSFVLAALGGFLFVRRLTRSGHAGLVAGLLYGFALYRVNQGPHLQVLSAQWFPFVLWALHAWWDERRLRHAVLGGLALAAQTLSNGYFLIYAALWLPPYVVAQVLLRREAGKWSAWKGPLITGGLGIALTAPFLYPYVQLRRLGQPPRPLAAVVQYSADSLAWLTANDQLRFWGSRLQTLVRPEGDLFPGLVPLVLMVVALVLTFRDRWWKTANSGAAPRSLAFRALAGLAALLLAAHAAAILLALFAGTARVYLGPLTISITDGTRLLIGFALSLAVLLAVSSTARRLLRDEPDRPVVLFATLVALTVWLSFGPIVHIGGRTSRTWPSLYGAATALVPGADALRVPPRIAMVSALALAVLGGLATAALSRRRGGHAVVGVLAVLFVAESWPAPIPINLRLDAAPFVPLTEPLPPRPSDHPLARALATLPSDAVLVDLPFGPVAYELWWQYLSAGHWRARINGYSGDMPPGFLALDERLAALPSSTDGALDALRAHGATHVVLHAGAWVTREEPDTLRTWLREQGATPVDTVGTSEIWRLEP